ncbi:hypothetical protein BJV78DRAFT_601326 [Lactifluus subvellereus]|nr:hypothetical protein BJV78DRAFT_601326 [Lactifluus subvellereus]
MANNHRKVVAALITTDTALVARLFSLYDGITMFTVPSVSRPIPTTYSKASLRITNFCHVAGDVKLPTTLGTNVKTINGTSVGSALHQTATRLLLEITARRCMSPITWTVDSADQMQVATR